MFQQAQPSPTAETTARTIQIKVAFLGGSRGVTGTKYQAITLNHPATVDDAVAWVKHTHPALAETVSASRWAVNYEFAELTQPLDDGDELALLPPVCGGLDAPDATNQAQRAPLTELTEAILDPTQVASKVHRPNHGAAVMFVGTVRNHSHGKAVHSLTYEAYRPMADKQLERIAKDCMQDHPGATVAITHRYGKLSVGDVSVVIAAGSPHREAAFAACRQALEAIKKDVPIWKREETDDGFVWVRCGGG